MWLGDRDWDVSISFFVIFVFLECWWGNLMGNYFS